VRRGSEGESEEEKKREKEEEREVREGGRGERRGEGEERERIGEGGRGMGGYGVREAPDEEVEANSWGPPWRGAGGVAALVCRASPSPAQSVASSPLAPCASSTASMATCQVCVFPIQYLFFLSDCLTDIKKYEK
jgi:hypothetical protein